MLVCGRCGEVVKSANLKREAYRNKDGSFDPEKAGPLIRVCRTCEAKP